MERPAYKLNAKVRTEERIYLKKEALIYSGCGSKEAHSQICDSLFAASDNEVYILDKNKLIKVSFNDEEIFSQEVIVECSGKLWSKFYCCVAKHGYLVACGEDEFFVLDLSTKEVLSKKLSENDRVFNEMNNCVDISVHCNETRLLLADNSGVITIFRLPSLERVAELHHDDAINNAKFSPNGRSLCAVGDNNKVFLYSIDENSPLSDDFIVRLNNPAIGQPLQNNAAHGQYAEERTLTLAPEYGDPQYCAWSADSSLIIVSHEDDNAFVLSGSTLNLVNQFAFPCSLSAATSPNSSLAVLCNRNKLFVFDMLDCHNPALNLKQQMIYVAHFRRGSVNGISFSPSGRKFFLVTPTGLYIMDVVTVDSLRALSVKSLGPDKLRESVEVGLAPQELYVEPYRPQKRSVESGDEDKEKLPQVFRVKLCASLSEIKELYGEYHAHDLDEESFVDRSYGTDEDEDMEDENGDEDEDGSFDEGEENDMDVD